MKKWMYMLLLPLILFLPDNGTGNDSVIPAAFIVPYLIVAALSLAAAELLRPKPPDVNPLADPGASTADVRGTIAPLLLGYNRVTPIQAWVGGRSTWQKKVGEIDGGIFHSDEDITQTEYRESAMHILCIGPALRLTKILQAGKPIFDSPLTPTISPSGTQWAATDGSEFRIYWGEPDQPIDPGLLEGTEVNSRYPYCCYIYWVSKELGTNARWQNLEYILECSTLGGELDFIGIPPTTFNVDVIQLGGPFFSNVLTTVDPLADDLEVGDFLLIDGNNVQIVKIDDNVFTPSGTKGIWYSPVAGISFGAYTVVATKTGTEGRGVNPILVIGQLLFDTYPHGQGLDVALFDTTSLDALEPYFADGGTEPSPATIYLKGGRSYKEALAMILQDYGIIMYPDAVTGLYTFKVLRVGETPTVLGLDYIELDEATDTKAYSVLAPQKTLYTFLESARKFKQSTILVDDDGKAFLSGNPNAKKFSINTATDITNASVIASRKEQEVQSDRSVSINVSSEKKDMNIGTLISLEGVSGEWRLLGKTPSVDEALIKMELAFDAYSIDNNYVQGSTTGIVVQEPAVPDPLVIVKGANRYLHRDQHGYYLIRARGNLNIIGATLYRSEDDIDYDSVAALDYQVGGTINDPLDEVTEGLLDELEITAGGTDFIDFWDVTLTDSDWRGGAVVALIGNEYFFVQSVTAVDSTTYTLNNLIRARFGTSQQEHFTDDDIVFFYKANTPFVSDVNIADGESLYFKTRPYTNEQLLDLDFVDPVQLDYAGGGYRPLAPDNLNTTNDAYAWILGDNVDLRWDYKNASALTGAGIGLSDEPSELALPEGYFKVTFLNGTTVVREETVLTNIFEYTQAMMVGDFGAEPSTFNVKVEEILNGLISPADTATITRV